MKPLGIGLFLLLAALCRASSAGQVCVAKGTGYVDGHIVAIVECKDISEGSRGGWFKPSPPVSPGRGQGGHSGSSGGQSSMRPMTSAIDTSFSVHRQILEGMRVQMNSSFQQSGQELGGTSQSIAEQGAASLANIQQIRNETLQSVNNLQAASALGMAIFHSFRALGATYLKANQDALAQAKEKTNAQRKQIDAAVDQVHASIASTNHSLEEAVSTVEFDGHILLENPPSESVNGMGTLKSPVGPFRDKLSQVNQRLIDAKPVSRPGVIAKNIGLEAVAAADSAEIANDTETADALLSVASAMADVAVGFIPVVGWSRDIFEAVSGQSLITGEELDVASRSIALFGAVTLGFGDELARIPQNGAKIIKALGKVARRFSGFKFRVFEKAAKPSNMIEAFARLAEHNPMSGVARAMDTPVFQLQKKFKHAGDFGVTGPMNKVSLDSFRAALDLHLADSSVRVIEGSYRRLPVVHFVSPATGLNVIKSYDGKFISAWKLSPAQFENVMKRGSL